MSSGLRSPSFKKACCAALTNDIKTSSLASDSLQQARRQGNSLCLLIVSILAGVYQQCKSWPTVKAATRPETSKETESSHKNITNSTAKKGLEGAAEKSQLQSYRTYQCSHVCNCKWKPVGTDAPSCSARISNEDNSARWEPSVPKLRDSADDLRLEHTCDLDAKLYHLIPFSYFLLLATHLF